jgi:hypothetical protein
MLYGGCVDALPPTCPRATRAPHGHSGALRPGQPLMGGSSVPGAGVFANAHQKIILSVVLVPGRVQEAMGSREDPAVTDEAGPT